MNNSLKKYLHELRMEKKQKRRLASFITAMSVFVSTGVFWQLRSIGTAMTDETLALNETNMAAALSAADGSLCETNEIWESTLPELTGELAENTALIAASQLNYTENTQNYTLGDDGCTHKNYSRYGAWFGNPYGDWNTMFTCFCLYYAGVKETDIPFGSGCWAWALKLNEKGVLSPLNKGSPKRGDVLLFDTDLDGKADRSGIISDISETCFITIEGQVGGAVAECRYSADDEHIIGYVPVETPEKTNAALMEFSAESASGIKVVASAERGIFPDDVKMYAADVSRDEAVEKAADALGKGTDDIEAVAVDISFRSPDGIELEPPDSSAVHVEIALPEEQKLIGDEFSLIHISDSGDTAIVENAEVSENGAEFDAESFSIYVVTAHGDKDKDHINEWLDGFGFPRNNDGYISNAADHPYYVRKGDTFTIKTKSYKNENFPYGWTDNAVIAAYGDYKYSTESDSNNVTLYVKERTFQAVNVGNERIFIDNGLDHDQYETFYIRVYESPKTISIDLDSVSNDINTPIDVNVNDIILISSNQARENAYFFGTNSNGGFESNPDCFAFDPSTNNGNTSNASVHISKYPTTESKIRGVGLDTVNGYKIVYFRINDYAFALLDHADIEIDDGGKYTFTKLKRNQDGSITKTITEYKAYVDGVNSSVLYQSSDDSTPCQFYYYRGTWVDKNGIERQDSYDKEVTVYDAQGNPQTVTKRFAVIYGNEEEVHWGDVIEKWDSSVTGYRADQYHVNPKIQPGTPQYEFTSKYNMRYENNELVYYDWSNTRFYPSEVDHVVFDVQLALEPSKETVYIKNGSEWVEQSTRNINATPDNTEHLSSVKFTMNHQDTIDAFNKCPNHSGLDFTVMAYSALVEFELTKELTGGTVAEDQFMFGIYDSEGKLVSTAANNASGIVTFNNLHFERAGNYNYTVKEIINDPEDNIIYDDKVINLSIQVDEDVGTHKLTAELTSDISNFTFTNHRTYTLPSTGGSGVVPYMITGSAIIIFSFAALLLRKRKEDK